MASLVASQFIQTFTGEIVTFPIDPTKIHGEDIGHGLALCNRWLGATKTPFSVAQHSLLGAQIAPKDQKLAFLLHDANEAYLGDIVTPLKARREYEAIRELENDVQNAIFARYRVTPNYAIIKEIDLRLAATEARDLYRGGPVGSWHLQIAEPYEMRIIPMPWQKVKEEFLRALAALSRRAA